MVVAVLDKAVEVLAEVIEVLAEVVSIGNPNPKCLYI
jgi:hypothetical protein